MLPFKSATPTPDAGANGSTSPLVEKNGDEEMGEYDPFAERNLTHPTSDCDTLVHLLKGSIGSGILAMPLAFSNAGSTFGLISTLVIGFICTYCMHMLVKVSHLVYKRNRVPALDYSEVAEAVFASGPEPVRVYRRLAKTVVDTFLCLDLYGCCCIYVLFVATNMKQVVDFYSGTDIDLRLYAVMLLPPLILMNLIRKLKWLAPLSLVANVIMAVGLCITFYYIFSDLPSLTSRQHFSSFQQLPLYFGTVIFALEGIGVIMSLENNMKSPQHFTGCPSVLCIGMFTVTMLYALVGYFGYIKYGDETKGAITLNLPTEEVLAQSVKIMIAIAILCTYCLQFYVPIQIIWRHIGHHFENCEILAECIIRVVLVMLSVGIAAAIPDLGPFMSFIGAVCLSTLGLVFPSTLEIVAYWDEPGFGRFKWILVKNILLIMFGLVGFVTGTMVSIEEFVITFSEEH